MNNPNLRVGSEQFIKVHDYNIGDQIGRGTFSQIRVAFHFRSKKPYAVKIISKAKLATCPRSKHIFFNETVLAALVDHPCIIDVQEMADSDSQIFQFMRFAEHGDLLHKLRKTPFEMSIAVRLIDQLLSAVEYLHSVGICHRDIKLENILLSRHGGIKLCDFGLASITFNGVITGNCGSYEYSAPEAIRSPEFDGFKADMWSVGVVIYAILSRRLPFPKVTPDYQFNEPIDFTPIPRDFHDLIGQLLSIDPTQRPSATECRALPLLKSQQVRPKIPLSSLRFDNSIMIDRESSVSTLSQVLGMQPDLFNSRLNSQEMNKEKLIYLLFQRKQERIRTGGMDQIAFKGNQPTPPKGQFFAPPPIANVAILEKRQNFPTSACTVFAALHSFSIRQKCCVSSPLSISPSIVLHKDGQEYRVSFHIMDEAGGSSSIILCADTASADLLSFLMKYLTQKLIAPQ